MEAFVAWFIALVSAYPTGLMILTIIGSIVVIASIVVPVVVKLTPTQKDDAIWEKISKHPIFAGLLKVLGSFSVYIPKKK